MGLMRATYLDVYRVCRRVMCAVCLCLSVFAECPLFSLCTMYQTTAGMNKTACRNGLGRQTGTYCSFLPSSSQLVGAD